MKLKKIVGALVMFGAISGQVMAASSIETVTNELIKQSGFQEGKVAAGCAEIGYPFLSISHYVFNENILRGTGEDKLKVAFNLSCGDEFNHFHALIVADKINEKSVTFTVAFEEDKKGSAKKIGKAVVEVPKDGNYQIIKLTTEVEETSFAPGFFNELLNSKDKG